MATNLTEIYEELEEKIMVCIRFWEKIIDVTTSSINLPCRRHIV